MGKRPVEKEEKITKDREKAFGGDGCVHYLDREEFHGCMHLSICGNL